MTKPDGTPTVEKKPKNEKLKPYKQKEPKKPFISEKEWEEIDEECMYIDGDD